MCDHVHGYGFEVFAKPALSLKPGTKLRPAQKLYNSWRNAACNINAASRIKRQRHVSSKRTQKSAENIERFSGNGAPLASVGPQLPICATTQALWQARL
jgi:hypothetical protein